MDDKAEELIKSVTEQQEDLAKECVAADTILVVEPIKTDGSDDSDDSDGSETSAAVKYKPTLDFVRLNKLKAELGEKVAKVVQASANTWLQEYEADREKLESRFREKDAWGGCFDIFYNARKLVRYIVIIVTHWVVHEAQSK